jgi:hypothetical protein
MKDSRVIRVEKDICMAKEHLVLLVPQQEQAMLENSIPHSSDNIFSRTQLKRKTLEEWLQARCSPLVSVSSSVTAWQERIKLIQLLFPWQLTPKTMLEV